MLLVPRAGTRRRFLGRMGAGFGAVAAWALARGQGLGAPGEGGGGGGGGMDPLRPFAPRTPARVPRAKSVIFVYLVGGPSSIDTFDYKPVLQTMQGKPVPATLRRAVEGTRHANVFHGCKDELMASPYAWRRYGETGLWVSELHPHLAREVDELCFVHSLQADSNNHGPASYQMHTGDIRPGKASLGSWVTYGLGTPNQDLPGYVMLFDAGPLGGAANYSNGFLPAAFQPTRLRDSGTPVLDLLPPDELAAGQRASLDLVRDLNLLHRERHPGFTSLDARIASYELAYRMQSAALEVGDVEDELGETRRQYGLEHRDERTRAFGRKCLLARRLVERGVRFVQLYDMPDKDGWDAHAKLTDNHTPRARWTDQPVAALLADLRQRGLLESTLVIWASEFGRTPMMQGDFGRQHNAAGFTVWLAGGGVRAGARIGATDEIGLMAVDRPHPFRDLHATLLTALGLDYEALSFEVNARQERLTGVGGRGATDRRSFGVRRLGARPAMKGSGGFGKGVGGMRDGGSVWAGAWLVLWILFPARASDSVALPTPPARQRVEIVRPALDGLEPAVREHLREAEASVGAESGGGVVLEERARVYAAYGFWAAAGGCYTNLLVREPGSARGWYGLAECRLAAGDAGGAVSAAETAWDLARSGGKVPVAELGEVRRLCGDALAAAGEFGKALARFEQVHLGEPADTYSPVRAAEMLVRLGRTREAAARLQRRLSQAPADAAAARAWERMLRESGEVEAADRVRRGFGEEEVAEVVRPDAWREEVRMLNRSSEAAFTTGTRMLAEGRTRAALTWFETAVRRQPGWRAARTQVAWCRLTLGEEAEARRLFGALRESAPEDARVRAGWLIAMARSGGAGEAVAGVRAWVAEAGAMPEVAWVEAEVQRAAGDPGSAAGARARLVKDRPKVARYRRELACDWAAAGRGEEAMRSLELAVRDFPGHVGLRLNLARFLVTTPNRELRNPEKSLEILEGLEGRANRRHWRETVALAKAVLGKWEEALAAVGTDSEISPEAAGAIRERKPFAEPWPFAAEAWAPVVPEVFRSK